MSVEDAERENIAASLVNEVSSAGSTAEPGEVVGRLKSQGFKEDMVRAVMWSLIDRRKLSMTQDWLLSLPVSDPPSVMANG